MESKYEAQKIVLIGAGSSVFTQGLVADFIQEKDFGKWEIALVDTDPLMLDSISALIRRMVESRRPISPSLHPRIAGSRCPERMRWLRQSRWEADVFIPRKYGIY